MAGSATYLRDRESGGRGHRRRAVARLWLLGMERTRRPLAPVVAGCDAPCGTSCQDWPRGRVHPRSNASFIIVGAATSTPSSPWPAAPWEGVFAARLAADFEPTPFPDCPACPSPRWEATPVDEADSTARAA